MTLFYYYLYVKMRSGLCEFKWYLLVFLGLFGCCGNAEPKRWFPILVIVSGTNRRKQIVIGRGAQPRGGGGRVHAPLRFRSLGRAFFVFPERNVYQCYEFLAFKTSRFCNSLRNFLQLRPPSFETNVRSVCNHKHELVLFLLIYTHY